MTFRVVLVTLFLAAVALAQSPPGISREWHYGGSMHDNAFGILEVDGGFLVVGMTQSWGAGLADMWLFKISADGAMEWDATYGGPDDDYGNTVIETQDGNYVILGGYGFTTGTVYGLWLIKVDPSGQLLWEVLLPGSFWDHPGGLAETPGGDLIITGTTSLGGYTGMKVCRLT